MKHLKEIGEYWNTRSEGYRLQIEKELTDNLQEIYEKYFREIEVGSAVLDVGCGPGMFCYLLNRMGMKVTGVDYSEKMLEQARGFVNTAEACPVKFMRSDAQDLPFESETFDAVVSRNLVWNLENPKKAYSEWLRVLKPGGKIFIFDGNHYSHLYHPEFAGEEAAEKNAANHILLGVKTNTIDEIAKELPLSKFIRPGWDKEALESLGAKEIRTDILEWLNSPKGQRLPLKFCICAEK